jgi:drug/metabolite transporter (DMT)-like permease
MNHNQDQLAARAAPVLFVLLWSTGFIGTKYVINNADPLTYLAIRMAVVVGLMAIIAVMTRPKWPDRVGIAHSAVAGILVHGFISAVPRSRSRIRFRRDCPRSFRACNRS